VRGASSGKDIPEYSLKGIVSEPSLNPFGSGLGCGLPYFQIGRLGFPHFTPFFILDYSRKLQF
jgi:hypothetical protein